MKKEFGEIEDLRILREAEDLADEIWDAVIKWDYFAKDTVGRQLVKAADSIGSNIAESCGAHHAKDIINFLYFSRRSLQETKFWLRRARRRKLIAEIKYNFFIDKLENLAPQLNSFINSKRNLLT
jgi:four helix bundle protein